jgi:hypothetical protein
VKLSVTIALDYDGTVACGDVLDLAGLEAIALACTQGIVVLLQTSRVFSFEPARCERVLGALVHAGDLATDGRAFARSRGGRRSA